MKNNVHIITVEGDGVCSDCGKTDELRPYGKDGAWVCFDCMMKDEENGKKMFAKRLDAGPGPETVQ